MSYRIKYERKVEKQLAKLDYNTRLKIYAWIEKNLKDTDTPRRYGKPLTGDLSGYWRYRVGDYRIIADINDNEIVIIIIDVGHRSKVYKR